MVWKGTHTQQVNKKRNMYINAITLENPSDFTKKEKKSWMPQIKSEFPEHEDWDVEMKTFHEIPRFNKKSAAVSIRIQIF